MVLESLIETLQYFGNPGFLLFMLSGIIIGPVFGITLSIGRLKIEAFEHNFDDSGRRL